MARSTNKRTAASGDAKFVCTDSKILESGRFLNTLILEGKEPSKSPISGMYTSGTVYHFFGKLDLTDPKHKFGKTPETTLTESMVEIVDTFVSEKGIVYETIDIKVV